MTTISDAELQQEVERNYRHNFIVNALDGSSFWLGYSFLTPATILPLYVSHLTNNNFLIGLIPMLSSAGFLLPQLFTSNWVQRLPRKKILPVRYGFFTERVPIFLLAPTALLFANTSPGLALLVFFLLFAWHAAGAGFIAVGWQDMVAKVIPTDRRGFFFGLTNFGGTITGVVGASAAAWVLGRYDFPIGYAIAFSAASFFIFISWIFIAMTREPAVHNPDPSVSQLQYLRSLPTVLRNDPNFLRYLLSQTVLAFGGMGIGFLTVYAIQRWQLSDSQAGTYTAVMLIGQSIANLIFGWLADRKGHKLVLELSALLAVLSFVLASVSPDHNWFFVVFALRGASFAGGMLSGIMIAFEFTTPEKRPTYIGLNNTIFGVAASVSPLVGGWLAGSIGFQWLFAISATFGLAGYILLRWVVREPRHAARFAAQSPEVGHA